MEHFNHPTLPVASDVTLATGTIHNPEEIRHFMKIRPVAKRVIVRAGDEVLADTVQALRLVEVGHDMYAPVLYIPRADVTGAIVQVKGETTYCPLKGDAIYFRRPQDATDAPPVAWCYPEPFGFAAAIAGHIAFDADLVTTEEIGSLS